MQQGLAAVTKRYARNYLKARERVVVLYEIIHRRDLEKYLRRFR